MFFVLNFIFKLNSGLDNRCELQRLFLFV